MTIVTIVEQNGSLSEKSVKDLKTDNYYKCCSYRKKDGFEKRTEWKVDIDKKKLKIEVWSRNDGKANTENKYDFPPPIDNELYFGKCLVVCYEKGNVCDLSNDLWLKVYEHLFGGFEDLSASALQDEFEEDELENIPDKMKTSTGYLKDDFVVDDDEELIMDDDENIATTSDESEFSTSGEQDELQFEEYEYSDEDKDKLFA